MSSTESKVPLIYSSFYRKLSIIALFLLLIFIFIFYVINKLDLNEENCKRIAITDDAPALKTINYSDDYFKYRLRDYYIKAAYNCCCAGEFKNDYVNLCALQNCILQGARLLDFEIYSIHDNPVIAASSINSNTYKETYNQLNFQKAMDMIKSYAFSTAFCPTAYKDPLILFFRINSKNKIIYNEMANILQTTFSKNNNLLLGASYGFEYNGNNLGKVRLKELEKKIIIAVLKNDNTLENTKLEEITNITASSNPDSGGSPFLRLYRQDDIGFATNSAEITQYNKLNMSIVLPNLNKSFKNMNGTKSYDYGCQMVGMNFQNFDTNLEFNNTMFESSENPSSFVLKPPELRADYVTIPASTPVKPNESCKGLKRCMQVGTETRCTSY